MFYGSVIPVNYLPADGRCLNIDKYRELSDSLHENDYWPYGKCDDNNFKLPDLRTKQNTKTFAIIKVNK